MTRRKAIQMLKTTPVIQTLDLHSYLTLLALKIEIGARDLAVQLAEVRKPLQA